MGNRTKDQEAVDAMWREYKASGTMEARNQLMLHYVSLAKYVAVKVAAGLPREVDKDDLVSFAIFGLMDAIEKFDLGKGTKFETYAMTRIRGNIIDELRVQDWVPRSTRSKARSLETAYAAVEKKFREEGVDRPIEDQDLADHLGITLPDLWALQSESNATAVDTLNGETQGDERQSLSDIVYDRTVSPEGAYDTMEILGLVAGAVAVMPARSKIILVLYYIEELTLREIGDILGVTESRVCQLQSKVLAALRDSLTLGLAQAA